MNKLFWFSLLYSTVYVCMFWGIYIVLYLLYIKVLKVLLIFMCSGSLNIIEFICFLKVWYKSIIKVSVIFNFVGLGVGAVSSCGEQGDKGRVLSNSLPLATITALLKKKKVVLSLPNSGFQLFLYRIDCSIPLELTHFPLFLYYLSISFSNF